MLVCPKCGLLSPDESLRCDCGYKYDAQTRQKLFKVLRKTRGAELIPRAWRIFGKALAVSTLVLATAHYNPFRDNSILGFSIFFPAGPAGYVRILPYQNVINSWIERRISPLEYVGIFALISVFGWLLYVIIAFALAVVPTNLKKWWAILALLLALLALDCAGWLALRGAGL